MSREIKFRIWDKKYNRWFHGGTDAESIRLSTDAINLFGEIVTMGEILRDQNTDEVIRLDRLKDLVALQYTGLLDKNGVEIYEGDIILEHTRSKTVKMPQRESGWSDWYDQRLVVYVEPGMWLTRPVDEPKGYTGHLVTVNAMARETGGYIEVVGNIWENPDLVSQEPAQ